jgi:hypothetical protein
MSRPAARLRQTVNAPTRVRADEGEHEMRFMLLQDYAVTEVAREFIDAWSPNDAEAHIEFQRGRRP